MHECHESINKGLSMSTRSVISHGCDAHCSSSIKSQLATEMQMNASGWNPSHERNIDVLNIGGCGSKWREQAATMVVNDTNESVGVIKNSDYGGGIMKIERHVRKCNCGTRSTCNFIRESTETSGKGEGVQSTWGQP